MKRNKRIYESMITNKGIIKDLKCPECEDGVTFDDYTHANGGEMIPNICHYCKGEGIVDEDALLDVKFDDKGKIQLIYKEADESCL